MQWNAVGIIPRTQGNILGPFFPIAHKTLPHCSLLNSLEIRDFNFFNFLGGSLSKVNKSLNLPLGVWSFEIMS